MTTDPVDPTQRAIDGPRNVEIVLDGELGETIPIGGAGLVGAYKHADAETIEPAVTRPDHESQRDTGMRPGAQAPDLSRRPLSCGRPPRTPGAVREGRTRG